MTNCINCKYSMIPKVHNIKLNFICTNVNQIKGLVKMNFKCDKGSK